MPQNSILQQIVPIAGTSLTVATANGTGVKFSKREGDREVARGFLYVLHNSLHTRPFGFMEDIFVEEDCRSKGYGGEIVQAIIQSAQALGCYKLLGTSRHEREAVHNWYKKLGFKDRGVEFRMDF